MNEHLIVLLGPSTPVLMCSHVLVGDARKSEHFCMRVFFEVPREMAQHAVLYIQFEFSGVLPSGKSLGVLVKFALTSP